MNYTVLIQTHRDKNGIPILPHLKWLRLSNPDAIIHIIIAKDLQPLENWRNCDRILRDWWKQNKSKISTSLVCVVEYDVLITKKLPHLLDNSDLCGNTLMSYVNESRWDWFRERDRLNLKADNEAVGLVPFAFLCMKRDVLDDICSNKWDSVYEKDIFCELRFPSIVRNSGYNISSYNLDTIHFCNINTNNVNFEIPGYFHSVKRALTPDETVKALKAINKNKYE